MIERGIGGGISSVMLIMLLMVMVMMLMVMMPLLLLRHHLMLLMNLMTGAVKFKGVALNGLEGDAHIMRFAERGLGAIAEGGAIERVGLGALSPLVTQKKLAAALRRRGRGTRGRIGRGGCGMAARAARRCRHAALRSSDVCNGFNWSRDCHVI